MNYLASCHRHRVFQLFESNGRLDGINFLYKQVLLNSLPSHIVHSFITQSSQAQNESYSHFHPSVGILIAKLGKIGDFYVPDNISFIFLNIYRRLERRIWYSVYPYIIGCYYKFYFKDLTDWQGIILDSFTLKSIPFYIQNRIIYEIDQLLTETSRGCLEKVRSAHSVYIAAVGILPETATNV